MIIGFSEPVDTQSVMKRLTVSPPLPGCKLPLLQPAGSSAICAELWNGSDTVLTFSHPGAIYHPSTTYTFTLAGGIVSKNGVINSLTHTWTIQSNSAPALLSSYPTPGSIDVPPDGPFSINFSRYMNAAATSEAITLSPDVAGTRVIPNRLDPGQFLLIPGSLLQSGATYAIHISTNATDQFAQGLSKSYVIPFKIGSLVGPHAVILSGPQDAPANHISITQLAPPSVGDPTISIPLLSVPAIPAPAIGPPLPQPQNPATSAKPVSEAGLQSATSSTTSKKAELARSVVNRNQVTGYAQAAISPDNRTLAVEEYIGSGSLQSTQIAVFSLPSLSLQQIIGNGAYDPVWSSNGPDLAYNDNLGTGFFDTHTDTISQTLDSYPPLGPVSWSTTSAMALVPVLMPMGPGAELLAPGTQAQYQVPDIKPPFLEPLLLPNGNGLVATRIHISRMQLFELNWTGSAIPVSIGDQLDGIGFFGGATLLCVSESAHPHLESFDLSTSSSFPIAGPSSFRQTATVSLSPEWNSIIFVKKIDGISQIMTENADGSGLRIISQYTSTNDEAQAGFFATG